MYCLVVKNLGVERCIDTNKDDIWESMSYYDCTKYFECRKVRKIRQFYIRCVQNPETRKLATVWQC